MKIINLVLCVIMLSAAATAIAQPPPPASFRNIATGRTIDDNLDLAFDPIELRFIEGMHLYTNLSNLTSTNEKLMNNISDNEFMLGAALANPWLKNHWTSFGWRMENTENSNWINIDPDLGYGWLPNENGWGQFGYDYKAFLDTDWDGVHDQEHTISQEVTDYVTDDNSHFALNNTYLHSLGTFGFLFSRGSRVTTDDISGAAALGTGHGSLDQYFTGSQTFDTDVAIHDIGGDYDMNTWSERGAFESTGTNTNTVFDLAYMTNWKKFEVRGDCGIIMNSDLEECRDRYHGEELFNDPAVSGYKDTYTETQTFDDNLTEEGTDFIMGCSIRETFQPGNARIDDGFWQAGANMRMGGYDYEACEDFDHSSLEEYFDGDGLGFMDFSEDISETELIRDKGSADVLGFMLWGRYIRQLGPNLTFGCSAGWTRNSTSLTADYLADFERVEEMDYNDNTFIDDYVQTETESFAADHVWEEVVSTLTFPVGLEYRTGERSQWAWRCSSRFTRTSIETTDEFDAIASECTPFTLEIDYDGATPDVETYGDNIYGSSKEVIHNTFSTTLFSYGVGYTATPNLQIDFLCVFDGGFDLLDSDFFKDLRLSITLTR